MKESLSPNTTLSHYLILSQLGTGGMGEVYLAQDTRLNRKVAIKLLLTDSTPDPQAKKRLIREAQAAATLDHPNICAIHEVGEGDGRSFIVMQYVEGETLANRIKLKPLELRQSLDIAVQVADALSEAHSRGIIHRDIKPQNIVTTARGQVKVLDFGLAKTMRGGSAADSQAQTESLLTAPSVIVGTVPYMSPEQVRGEELDARSDVFSFGTVCYEMISGRSPFASDTQATTLSAILTSDPPPLARYMPEIPDELQRVVRKCLEKDRERRYQTTRDLTIDLENVRRAMESGRAGESLGAQTPDTASAPAGARWTRWPSVLVSRAALGIAILAVLMIAAYALFWKSAPRIEQPVIKSLAVLPLQNLSGDPSQDYFADGMTEALISNLAQIRALKVISRTSVMRYKGSDKLLPDIARELNVEAVIEGSVQRAGGRVHVTARLIPAAADSPSWSRDYDRDLSDVLKLQSEVARAVADEIRIQVTADERARLASARKVDPQAHEAYLLGRYHIKRNEEDLKQAIEYFERAIQLAPDYAAAYAGLSDAWVERGIWGAKTFRGVESPARNAALKAVELDTHLAEAHTALGHTKFIYDWDWVGAEQEHRLALELDPGSAYAHHLYADVLMSLGRHAEAIREMQNAEQLDPLSSDTQSSFGRVLYRARKYEEAILHFKRAIDLDPRNYSAYIRLGDVYAKLGRYDEAIAAFEKAGELRT